MQLRKSFLFSLVVISMYGVFAKDLPAQEIQEIVSRLKELEKKVEGIGRRMPLRITASPLKMFGIAVCAGFLNYRFQETHPEEYKALKRLGEGYANVLWDTTKKSYDNFAVLITKSLQDKKISEQKPVENKQQNSNSQPKK